MQWDFPLLFLLARTDVHCAVPQVDVLAVESEGLPGTHARDGQQPDQRLMTRRAQPRSQLPRGGHQRRDLRLGVDVWGDPRAAPRQQVLGRDLARGVDRGQMPGEPARDPEPLAPTVRIRVDGHPCPLQRQLGGDPLGAHPLEKLDEPLEQPVVLRHCEPEPATDPQVVVKGRTQ